MGHYYIPSDESEPAHILEKILHKTLSRILIGSSNAYFSFYSKQPAAYCGVTIIYRRVDDDGIYVFVVADATVRSESVQQSNDWFSQYQQSNLKVYLTNEVDQAMVDFIDRVIKKGV